MILGSLLVHSLNGFLFDLFLWGNALRISLALQNHRKFLFFLFFAYFFWSQSLIFISIFILLFWSSLDNQLVYKPFFSSVFVSFFWNLWFDFFCIPSESFDKITWCLLFLYFILHEGGQRCYIIWVILSLVSLEICF
jgi:hypothetical protein